MNRAPLDRLALQSLALRAQNLDGLAAELGCAPAALAEVLERLELNGQAHARPSGRWVFGPSPSHRAGSPEAASSGAPPAPRAQRRHQLRETILHSRPDEEHTLDTVLPPPTSTVPDLRWLAGPLAAAATFMVLVGLLTSC